MKNLNSLKENILRLVEEYYQSKPKEKFVSGKTYIPYGARVYDAKELMNLVDSSLEFWLTAGRYARKFENKIADAVGVKYASLVNSGSSANLLAVAALTSDSLGKRRLKAGDEVITTAATFPTTVAPIIQNRLIPVFVDIALGTYNADLGQVKKAISRKTKAIFLAHTLGNPFDLAGIKKICQEYNLWLLEDNCDALGAQYQGKRTGSFGDISTCSFYPAHQITLGEGGAVLTNTPLLNKIINSLRDWGRDCWCLPGKDNTCARRFKGKFGSLPKGYDHKYVYAHLGYNLKVTDLQAAIGLAQLDKLDGFVRRRRENFRYLYSRLKVAEDKIILPQAEKGSLPSWFGFLITLKAGNNRRQHIQGALEKAKIQTRLLFAGNITRQPCFLKLKTGRDFRVAASLTNTDKVMRDAFWVGVYPGINREMLEYMAGKIISVL